ncbi:MAG: HAMP domain-containing sensor histidine kinase [bacterium]|nr:HAMP domain-containing sensor histidine kinase [bacterium]
MPDTKSKSFKIRLPKFFNIVRIISIAVILLFTAVFYYFPEYFEHFVLNGKLLIILLLLISFINIVFYLFIAPFVKQRSILYINNIIWAIFMFGIVYVTGGVWSSFVIILIFPIITAAFDLEAPAAGITGGLIIALFLAMLFGDTRFPHTKSYFTAGFSLLLFLGMNTYYIYSIIKGTLRQKYEKEETARKYTDLLEADKAKSEFLTVASHQLRTPLSELKWSLSALKEDQTIPDTANKSIVKTIGSVDNIIKIASDILIASEQTRDESKYQMAPADLIVVISEIIGNLNDLSKRKNVNIRFNDHPMKIILAMDQEKLRLALNNIVDNAVRYSRDCDINIVVKEAQEILIEITDIGIGIPSDQQDRIFTKLFRARNAISLEPNETGLGLFIAKNIIEKHNGRIWFVSSENKGTTFFVALPK